MSDQYFAAKKKDKFAKLSGQILKAMPLAKAQALLSENKIDLQEFARDKIGKEISVDQFVKDEVRCDMTRFRYLSTIGLCQDFLKINKTDLLLDASARIYTGLAPSAPYQLSYK